MVVVRYLRVNSDDHTPEPAPYLAHMRGSLRMYPQFSKWLDEVKQADITPVRVTTFKNKFKTSRDNAVFNMSRMAGRLVNWLANIEGLSPAVIVNQLTAHLGEDDIPARLRMPLPPEIISGEHNLIST